MREDGGVSFSAFAKLGGFKPSYVTELKAKGRLVLTEDGKAVMPDASFQRMRDTADPSKVGVAARHAAARENPDQGAPERKSREDSEEPGSQTDEPGQTTGYQHWRERRERAAALQAERENELAERKLLNAAEVESAIAHAVTQVRTGLELLPSELAPQLAPIDDEDRVQAILADAIEQRLAELARVLRSVAGEAA